MKCRQIDESKQVVVAVIDSGLDVNHPDLEGRVWQNPICEELSEEERSKKPCQGRNFLAKSEEKIGDVSDDTGHGTHVSGIIAANMNGTGAVGVTKKNVKIMPLKVLSKETTNFVYNNRLITDIVADAMAFAVQNKADVINLSMGWPKLIETPRMKKLFNWPRRLESQLLQLLETTIKMFRHTLVLIEVLFVSVQSTIKESSRSFQTLEGRLGYPSSW